MQRMLQIMNFFLQFVVAALLRYYNIGNLDPSSCNTRKPTNKGFFHVIHCYGAMPYKIYVNFHPTPDNGSITIIKRGVNNALAGLVYFFAVPV